MLFQPAKCKKRKPTYSPNKLFKALSEVKKGILTPTEASKIYNIPRPTISCKINGLRPAKFCRRGPEAVLGML